MTMMFREQITPDTFRYAFEHVNIRWMPKLNKIAVVDSVPLAGMIVSEE
jgi:hypothetical protein